uniref:8,0K protein protein n=1 Tax=Garlic common latent virus TaxID=47900 RepID=Q67546_9VIRU|nr:8,0K protein [Garlic common latent virus]
MGVLGVLLKDELSISIKYRNMEVEFLIRCGTIRYLTENPQSRKNSIYRSDYAKINRTCLRVYCRVSVP